MTTIHMETDKVQVLAKQLAQNADAIQQQIETINGRVQTLSWEGQSSELFRAEFGELKRRFDILCTQCETLGIRVQREADEWIQVDQTGKDHFTVAPGFWEDMKRSFRDFYTVLCPYTLEEGFEELLDTPAGRDLIDYATKNKIRINVKDDGSYGYQGNDATIIEIDWGGGVGGARYGDGKIFVDDDFFSRRFTTREQVAAIVGHEIQHAVDDKTGQFYRSPNDDLNRYTSLDPQQQEVVRQDVAHELETRIDSEIRAYERQDAILHDRSFQDDGVNTGSERQEVLDHGLDKETYEAYYEKTLAEDYPGLDFDVYVDDSGKIQVNILEKKA